jgi:hypothetical protein
MCERAGQCPSCMSVSTSHELWPLKLDNHWDGGLVSFVLQNIFCTQGKSNGIGTYCPRGYRQPAGAPTGARRATISGSNRGQHVVKQTGILSMHCLSRAAPVPAPKVVFGWFLNAGTSSDVPKKGILWQHRRPLHSPNLPPQRSRRSGHVACHAHLSPGPAASVAGGAPPLPWRVAGGHSGRPAAQQQTCETSN